MNAIIRIKRQKKHFAFFLLVCLVSHSFSQEAPAPEPAKVSKPAKAAPVAEQPKAVKASAPAAAQPVASEVEVAEPDEDYAVLTAGIWTGEHYFEGRLDALVPLYVYANGDGRLFLDLRGAWADEGEDELNLGLAMRRRCLPNDGILGLSTFYDSRWTKEGAHFNQWGVGGEVLTEWVDMRANYYLPEHKEAHIGSQEEKNLAEQQYKTDYVQYAENNQLREAWSTYLDQTWTYDKYDFYTYPLKGYDAEIGVKLPLDFHRDFETRVFLGYYDFDHRSKAKYNSGSAEVSGLKSRVEVRGWNKLFLDAEIYEDKDLFGSKFMLSARYRVPIGQDGRTIDGSIDDRMSELVMRDPHIQLRTGVNLTQTSENTRTRIGQGDVLLLDNTIFVNADKGGPEENGTGQRPFDKIQEGVDFDSAGSFENVYVFGARREYNESVVIESGLGMYGEGHKFGHGYPGLGIAPVVRGDPASGLPGAFNVFASDPVTIAGFNFLGGRASQGMPTLEPMMGVFAQASGELSVFDNNFRNLLAGVLVMPGEDSRVEIFRNNFNNVGAGILAIASFEGSYLWAHDNVIENSLLGIGAIGGGPDAAFEVIINKNIISGSSSDVGGYVDPEFLANVLMTPEMFEDFGMEMPSAWPLPSIAGIVVGAVDGAEVSAGIFDNTIRGSLFGIMGLSANDLGFGFFDFPPPTPGALTSLSLNIQGNTLIGGGFDATYGLFRAHAGSVGGFILNQFFEGDLDDQDMIDLGTMLRDVLPESLGTDFGLSGITLLALGEDASIDRAFIAENTINNYVLGLGALSIEGASIQRLYVYENSFADDFIGALALAAGYQAGLEDLVFYNNTFQIGGSEKLSGLVNAILPELGFSDELEIPNGGLLGIGVATMGYESYANEIVITGNEISGALAGVLAFSSYDTSIDGFIVAENTFTDNLISVAGIAYGDDASLRNVVIADNTITGGGSVALLGLLDGLLGGGVSAALGADMSTYADKGLLGIGLFALDNATVDGFSIVGNTVSDNLIGVGLLTYVNWNLTTSMENGVVFDNTIDGAWAGILAGAFGGSLDGLLITGNSITAGTDDIFSGVMTPFISAMIGEEVVGMPGLVGIGLFAGEDGSIDNAEILDNDIDGFLWGIFANAGGDDASIENLLIRNNALNANAIGIQVSGESGASIDEAAIRNNSIQGSTVGIIAYISDDDNYGTSSDMTFRITGNTLVGSGADFGRVFYASTFFSEMLTQDNDLALQDIFFLDGMDDIPGDFNRILPQTLQGMDPEDIGWNTMSGNGFTGIVTSFKGVDGGKAVIRDNDISGFRNGIFIAVNDSDDIKVTAKDNISLRNRVVGNSSDYSLTLSGPYQVGFSHLW